MPPVDLPVVEPVIAGSSQPATQPVTDTGGEVISLSVTSNSIQPL